MTTPAVGSIRPPLFLQNVPELLKAERRWVAWRAGKPKANGKFDKVPVDPRSGRQINPLLADNWLTIEQAVASCGRLADGIGIVLSAEHPITHEGREAYLVAIDLDHCANHIPEHREVWRELGRPYCEVSPSGHGLRMLGLCNRPGIGGNAGAGRELYFDKRFVTVTGWNGRGLLKDFSQAVGQLEQRWFARNESAEPRSARSTVPVAPPTLETVSRVLGMLDHVSPATNYEEWRNIIWAIASTGWPIASTIAHKWSAKAPSLYEVGPVDKLLAEFDPSRGITLGTLAYAARQNGWQDSVPATKAPEGLQAAGSLLTASELRGLRQQPYLVRGLLPARGLVAIYGEPGSGKSFLAMDLAFALAHERSSWFGLKIKQAAVAYVSLEGQGGLARRVTALEFHTGQACGDRLQFWIKDFALMDATSLSALVQEVRQRLGPGAVIFIDTLNQASPGADENSSQDMGRIIAGAKALAAAIEGVVVLVHHSGKNRAQGLRGHSSLLAAMDSVVEVQKDSNGRHWRVAKAKDDADDVERDFDLIVYEVGQDADGSAISSCAISPALHCAASRKAPLRGKNQRMALTALKACLAQRAEPITHQLAVEQVTEALSSTTGRAAERAKEAVNRLIAGGHLGLNQGCVTLAP